MDDKMDDYVMLSSLRDWIGTLDERKPQRNEIDVWGNYLDKLLQTSSKEIPVGLDVNPIKYKRKRRSLFKISTEEGTSRSLYESEDADDSHESNGALDKAKKTTPDEIIEMIWKAYLVKLSPLHMRSCINKIEAKVKNHMIKGIAWEKTLRAHLNNARSKKEKQKIQTLLRKLNIISAVGSRLDEVGAKYVCECLLGRKDSSTGEIVGAQKFAGHIMSLGGLIGKDGKLTYVPTDNPQINERSKKALTNRLQRWITASKNHHKK